MKTAQRTKTARQASGTAGPPLRAGQPAPRVFKQGLNTKAGLSLSRVRNARSVSTSGGIPLPTDRVRQANRWREQLNPLRRLTINRAVSLVETWDQGMFADLQWTYRAIERGNETLSALLNRRQSALLKLDWQVRTVPEDDLPAGMTSADAEAQRAFLRAAYDRLTNLREAIAFLALAEFRGFAHVEKQDSDGDGLIDRIEPVNQWNLVRDGLQGPWFYNEGAIQRNAAAMSAETKLDEERFIIITCERHVDWVALFCHIRATLGVKDWAAFVEGFGLNSTIVIGPPGVPPDREAEYAAAAANVAAHGSGYLPNGSDVKYANAEKGTVPFKEYVEAQRADIVLIGTGGKLTMLNEPTGLGSGQSQSHQDTFEDIARGHAARLSEALQGQFDRPLLTAAFPGQPVLAYFELAANEETDTSAFVKDVGVLATAGYQVDSDQIAEKTGYEVTAKTPANPVNPDDPAAPSDAVGNPDPEDPLGNRRRPVARLLANSARRAALSADTATLEVINQARTHLQAANQMELRPLYARVAELFRVEPEQLAARAAALSADLRNPASDLRQQLGSVDQSAEVLAKAIGTGLVNGLLAGTNSVSA